MKLNNNIKSGAVTTSEKKLGKKAIMSEVNVIVPFMSPTPEDQEEMLMFFKPFDDRITDNSKKQDQISNWLTVNVLKKFKEYGYQIRGWFNFNGQQIKDLRLPYQHYSAFYEKTQWAKKDLTPEIMAVGQQKLAEKYGEKFAESTVLNAYEVMEKYGFSAVELAKIWREGEKQQKLVTGLYCGRRIINNEVVYILNGHYPGQCEYFFGSKDVAVLVLRGKKGSASFKSMRNNFIGLTNPKDANSDSIRGKMFAKFGSEIDATNNGTHLSAGPIEAMRELVLWLGIRVDQTILGKKLKKLGLTAKQIRQHLFTNPEVTILKDGVRVTKSMFDWTEEMDMDQAIEFIKEQI